MVPAAAIETKLAGRICSWHLYQLAAAVFQLVFQFAVEFCPRCIADGLRHAMVLHHSLHIQVLYADDLVLVRQPVGHLVLKEIGRAPSELQSRI